MPNQLLTPFKAKFVISVKTTILEYFKDSEKINLQEKYQQVLKENGDVDVVKFIKHYQFYSKIYNDYKDLDFRFNKVFDVVSESIFFEDVDLALFFKLESTEVEVLQITNNGNQITFANIDKEVKTVNLLECLKLIKV